MTTQGVILARGLGTRMRRRAAGGALSTEQEAAANTGAKGMMPFGRPFMDYVLSALADAGIVDVCLVIGPGHDAIRDYYVHISPPQRVRVRFAIQAEPRGTADAVLATRDVVRDENFLVLNSDNYYPVEAYRAVAALNGAGLAGFDAESLVRESGIEEERVLRYALIDADDNGVMRAIREKPAATDPFALRPRRLVSMNLWSFTPRIFEACDRVTPSPRGELEIQDAVTIAMRELGEVFRVAMMSGGVLDLSSRADVGVVAAKLAGLTANP